MRNLYEAVCGAFPKKMIGEKTAIGCCFFVCGVDIIFEMMAMTYKNSIFHKLYTTIPYNKKVMRTWKGGIFFCRIL